MKYKIIYADPAWIYQDKANAGKRGAEHKYKCSTIEEMGKIDLNAADDSILLMWVTFPQLPEGLKLMKLWDFEYKTVAFTWVKTNPQTNSFFMGMGRYTRSNPEICLLGKKGKGVSRKSCNVLNLQIHKIRNHSRKPDAIRNEIIKLFGDLPRVELFSRIKLENWDAVGDEVPKETQRLVTHPETE